MNIDAPADSVAIWLRADIIYCRFPDRQLIEFPATEIARLRSILAARERGALNLGGEGAPTQWQFENDYDRKLSERIKLSVGERLERDRRKLERDAKKAAKAHALREAEKLLEELGL